MTNLVYLILALPLLWFLLFYLPKKTVNRLAEKDLTYTPDSDVCKHAHGHLWRRYICPAIDSKSDILFLNRATYYFICPVCKVQRS